MATGTRYSYTDTTTKKAAISDAIFNIDWKEAALLRLAGFDSGNIKKIKAVNWPQTSLTWLEDTNSPFSTTIAEDLDNSETGVDVATGHGQYFRQGDMVGVETSGQVDEKFLVTSVSSDTLTVVRGYGDTSGTTHSNGETIRILSRAMPEASDYVTGHSTVRTQVVNNTQIISQAVKVSKSEMAVQQYGISDAMSYEIAKLFDNGGSAGKLPQLLQRTWYYGEKVARDANNYGSMGGYETFVTTSTASTDHVLDLNGAPLQRSDIHRVIRAVRDAGEGRVTHLVCGSWAIEKITAMYEGSITTGREDKVGGSEIQVVRTPHGEVKLVYDWMCPADRLYFVNFEKCGWAALRPFTAGKIAEQGDYFVTDIVGEFTFFLTNPKSFGMIKEISTTS